MSLSAILKSQNYDLIDGVIRNHKPLQLCLKENGERAILHYDHLSMAFKVPNVPKRLIRELFASSGVQF